MELVYHVRLGDELFEGSPCIRLFFICFMVVSKQWLNTKHEQQHVDDCLDNGRRVTEVFELGEVRL